MGDREPCPYRIIDDVGGAFIFGAVGGGIFHTIKGFRNAPKGARLRGSMTAVKARSPVLGGNFAVWGGLFACCDCTMVALRHKEDPWNSIISGAATGGILALRAGPKTAAKNALVGGVLLALIEGLGIGMTKVFSSMNPEDMPKILQPGGDEATAAPEKRVGPQQAALAPPIPMPTFSSGYSRGSAGGGVDVDSSAPRQADVITSTGFDTDSKFNDPFAQQDPFANSSSGALSQSAADAPKRGWLGGLFGRGRS